MYRKLLLIGLLCVMCLVGCSNKEVTTLDWNDGTITANGKEINAYEVTRDQEVLGYSLMYSSIYPCSGINSCEHVNNVTNKEVLDYKRAKYVIEDDSLYMYLNGFEAYMNSSYFEEEDILSTALDSLYSSLGDAVSCKNVNLITINNKVKIDVTDLEFFVSKDSVSVLDCICVYDNIDDTFEAESTVVIDGVELGLYSTTMSDYYLYDGLVLQVAKGSDISSRVKFGAV